ncbi:MAG: hypothetical protein QOF58_531 [Pseudonocardiales bacterium]|nr:hypothetical protein [Pseudonocardiales bacterium]
MVRVPRQKQRTDALRERGLAGAMEVLAEEGVAGLTTRTVARRANASVPAIYEVFGDKAGLVREVFFEGFRLLGDELADLPDLRALAAAFRRFIVGNPVLAEIMFARPFADFDPTADETRAGVKVRKIFVHHVRAAIEAGQLDGDPADLALIFFTFVQGMAAAECARRLGGSKKSVDRRWQLGLTALISGFQATPTSAHAAARR